MKVPKSEWPDGAVCTMRVHVSANDVFLVVDLLDDVYPSCSQRPTYFSTGLERMRPSRRRKWSCACRLADRDPVGGVGARSTLEALLGERVKSSPCRVC